MQIVDLPQNDDPDLSRSRTFVRNKRDDLGGTNNDAD